MTTTTHRLTWPDGTAAAVAITSAHPNDEAQVEITGARDRVAGLPAITRPTLLALELQQLADATAALLVTTHAGEYLDENDVG